MSPASQGLFALAARAMLNMTGARDQNVEGARSRRTSCAQDRIIHLASPGDGERPPVRPQYGQQRGRPSSQPATPLLGDIRGIRSEAPAV